MRTLLLLALVMLPGYAFAGTAVTVSPSHVIQGEPFIVHVSDTTLADVSRITFNGMTLKPFAYKGVVSAFAATALTTPPGEYVAKVSLIDGTVSTTSIMVEKRPRIEKPFDIPQKLGGNTTPAAKRVVSTLASDNAKLANLKSQARALWTKPFAYPVADPVVTDTFGYQRSTVGYEITHKGTDFHAPTGTLVIAANRGIVRLTKTFGTYGKTIVIDHGLGIFTFYMHLSKIKVAQGQLVDQGQEIGLSGQSGYAEGAHLHFTVRIGNTSVDPEKFITLLQ